MVFSSISFLFFFLPAVLIIYYLMPAKARNLVLLAASLLFYAWGEPAYLVIMIVSCLSGYFHGLLIENKGAGRHAKLLLGSSIIVSLGMLLFFKYSDFLITNLNSFTGSRLELLHIVLPIGISFYTFQVISYTIDVYRGQISAQKNLIDFAAYITFFPQLIAGPIVRYSDISYQLTNRLSYSKYPEAANSKTASKSRLFEPLMSEIANGIMRFTIGLAKKVMLANSFGELVSLLENNSSSSVLSVWLLSVAFTLQIYFDFSGYSDMAIGLGRMFGFHFPENFRYPLTATSISDFWRRWHISLGSWFRDYVYFPLGGSRCSNTILLRNLLIVWLLTGLWHGAAWNFIIWGLYFAVLLSIEKLTGFDSFKLPNFLKRITTIVLILISFIIFYSGSWGQAASLIRDMLPGSKIASYDSISLYYLRSYLFTFVIGIVAATPIPAKAVRFLLKERDEYHDNSRIILSKMLVMSAPLLVLALLVLSTAGIVDSSFNPFIYFRF